VDSEAAELRKHPNLAAAEVRPAAPSVLGPRFEVVLHAAAVAELAELPTTAYIEFVLPPFASRDSTTDLESNIGAVRDFPPNLDGSGIKAAVREIGIPTAHVDFNSRLTRIDGNGSSSGFEISHATGVVGQVGSSGVAVPAAKGGAPNVAMFLYSLVDGAFLTNDILDAAGRGARVSNHSYGPTVSSWGDYQTTSADWDSAIRGNNLIGMFAGNEEAGQTYKHIDFFVGAKNTVCVGATGAAARAGPPKVDGIAYFSQFGPMNDGRVKPDVVAFGDGVTLCADVNSSQTNSGTSFSTPAVTGITALLFQQYKSKAGSEPSGALAKALLCNSAADLGTIGPDGVYGFGLVDAQAAVSTINLRQSASVSPFFEGVLNNGDSQSFTVNLQSSGEFKITLCWQDPGGNPMALKALVNDLDLLVTAPDSTKSYPFSLDPANPSNPATATGANTVDPIEQVIVPNPAMGIWTVAVKGTSIVSGPQSFAVCINKPKEPLTLMPVILASPSQGNTPLTVAFSASSSTGEIVSYAWDFGDGSTGQGVDVTHTYSSPGTFTVILTVTDNKGKTASATTIISVVKRVVDVFPSRAMARLDFSSPSRDKLQMVLTVPELVRTAQQWRDQLKTGREEVAAGTFVGETYNVSVGNTKLATFTTDSKGSFKSKTASLKLNPPQGTLTIQFNGNAALDDIFAQAGMTKDPGSSGLHELPVTIETEEAIYNATFQLLYKNTRAKTGTAKTL
jgi:PKD repeat protein